MQNYNEIRYDARRNTYYLAVNIEDAADNTNIKCAIIELKEEWFDFEKVYKIVTAFPKEWKKLQNYELICVKPRL